MVELKYLSDIYKDTKEGKSRPIKLNIQAKMFIDIKDIVGVVETFNGKGKVYKNQCAIHHMEMGRIFIKHKYEFIKNLKKDDREVTVIKGYTNRRKVIHKK